LLLIRISRGIVHTALNRRIAPKEELENRFLGNICLGSMAEPKDITRVLVFLLGNEARYITYSVAIRVTMAINQLLTARV